MTKSIKTLEFEAELYRHGSWGARDIGKFKCTMDFYEGDDADHAMIEWDIPELEETEHIGLRFEMRDGKRALIDYDGIMALPKEAVELMESLGIIVDEEFKS